MHSIRSLEFGLPSKGSGSDHVLSHGERSLKSIALYITSLVLFFQLDLGQVIL